MTTDSKRITRAVATAQQVSLLTAKIIALLAPVDARSESIEPTKRAALGLKKRRARPR